MYAAWIYRTSYVMMNVYGSDGFDTFFSCFMFAEMNKYWFIVLQWRVVQVVESRFWRTQVKMIIELDSAEIVWRQGKSVGIRNNDMLR